MPISWYQTNTTAEKDAFLRKGLTDMDFWMLERSKLEKDVLTVFSALDGLQARYDWVISDTDLYFRPSVP